jgi:hypothetical protein
VPEAGVLGISECDAADRLMKDPALLAIMRDYLGYGPRRNGPKNGAGYHRVSDAHVITRRPSLIADGLAGLWAL